MVEVDAGDFEWSLRIVVGGTVRLVAIQSHLTSR